MIDEKSHRMSLKIIDGALRPVVGAIVTTQLQIILQKLFPGVYIIQEMSHGLDLFFLG